MRPSMPSQPSPIAPEGPSRPALIRRPSLAACFGAIREPELYRNFAIHLFVMFPAAMVMCFVATKVDAELALAPLGPWPAEIGRAHV